MNNTTSISKEEYKEAMETLGSKLAVLQLKVRDLKIPVMIVCEGFSAAGKGTLISKVLYPLDPRYFNVYTMNKVNEDAVMRPYLWKYWTRTPARGRITIIDKSWHRSILPENISALQLKENEIKYFYEDVNLFEKQLTDDGTVIIKLFLHITKEEQKKRLKELEKTSTTKWRVNKYDIKQNEQYGIYQKYYDEMIEKTDNENAEWNIINAEDKKSATISAFTIIIEKLEAAIAHYEAKEKVDMVKVKPEYYAKYDVLSKCDVNKDIEQKEYKNKLNAYQKRISELGYELYLKRKSVVIVYEGWDAAGKGGNIKRLTEELDPRGYEVVPVAAPTSEELAHHYLWRFWNKMPKDGHMTIFDRSWYGRVMVERLEGFCSKEEWNRAYKEINNMEFNLANHGTIVLKFWLHIDQDEQLARFKSRQEDPLKQYKITAEDWRNREKWDDYEIVVNEMIYKTNKPYAPWHIIEANSKKYARIKVLEYVIQELEKNLR